MKTNAQLLLEVTQSQAKKIWKENGHKPLTAKQGCPVTWCLSMGYLEHLR